MGKGTGIERRQYFGGTIHTKLIQALLFPAQLLCGDLETRGSRKHIVTQGFMHMLLEVSRCRDRALCDKLACSLQDRQS